MLLAALAAVTFLLIGEGIFEVVCKFEDFSTRNFISSKYLHLGNDDPAAQDFSNLSRLVKNFFNLSFNFFSSFTRNISEK